MYIWNSSSKARYSRGRLALKLLSGELQVQVQVLVQVQVQMQVQVQVQTQHIVLHSKMRPVREMFDVTLATLSRLLEYRDSSERSRRQRFKTVWLSRYGRPGCSSSLPAQPC